MAGTGSRIALRVSATAISLTLTILGTGSAQSPSANVRAHFTESPPVIDGTLDDPAWQAAPATTGIVQFQPSVGAQMSEPTEFRVLYDEEHIYLGVWCFDSDPASITARRLTRDGYLPSDDYIYFLIDTFHDQRNGYAFSVNPRGARWDATVSKNTNLDGNWDGIWAAECSIDDKGWYAEVAIPFDSIDFDPTGSTWGFNLERVIRRNSEYGRWSGPRPDFQTYNASEAGDLVGLEPPTTTLGFEFRPYAVGRYRFQDLYNSHGLNGDVGADLRYRLTPDLSLTLSYNTDFAETEVDRRQINFTRFPLFFPEKRAFFLEDNSFYQFAENFDGLLVPYFSRRIGLSSSGEPVPVITAAKVAGHFGQQQIGFTGALVDGLGALDQQHVFATRFSRNLWEQSSLGFLATYGDPNSTGDNLVAGPDFRFRTSSFLGDKNLSFDAFFLGSQTDSVTAEDYSDVAYGLNLAYPNDTFNASAKFLEIGENFDPALGFVRRKGVRYYATEWRYLYRPDDVSRFQYYSAIYANQFFTGLDNTLESSTHSVFPLAVRFASDDELSVGFNRIFDATDSEFAIGDDLVIPAGRYHSTDYSIKLTFSDKRAVGGSVEVSRGDFYGGDRFFGGPSIRFYASDALEIALDYQLNHFSIPTGELTTHLTAGTVLLKFTPDLWWANTVQYDSISNSVGFNSRVQWEFLPGSKTFLSLNQNYAIFDRHVRLADSELALKLGLNVRF